MGRVLGESNDVFAWQAQAGLRILESSSRGALAMFLGEKFDYYATEYHPAKIASGSHPRAYADFQALHYEGATFDIVVASDVFEHIRNDTNAMREVHRVLKPGGYLILTVPYDHDRGRTIQRVDTTGPRDVHVLPPQYHGGGGHTLAYREYGRDVLTLMTSAGFHVVRDVVDRLDFGITPQSVFVARKDGTPVLAPAPEHGTGSTGPMLPYRLFVAYKYGSGAFFSNPSLPSAKFLFRGFKQLAKDARNARRR